jgi:DNA-binding NarL/FixJ family response regulator
VKRPRVLLGDDHTLVLEGFEQLLQPELDVVGKAEDGRALLNAARKLKPDVILLDISMPLLNGIDAARQLRRLVPATKIIFVTMHADQVYVTEAFRAGASGYVLKRSAASELVTAVREVLAGRFYVTPLVAKNAVQPLTKGQSKTGGLSVADLTPRQREVLQLVAEGRSAKEIGAILKISVKTVEFHKASITQGLGLHKAAELTKFAIQTGLVEI